MHKRNNCFSAVVVGSTGSGKSWFAGNLLSKLDPTYTADRTVFSYPGFKEFITSDEMGKGKCLMADEAGAWISSRDSMSKRNKHIGKIVQTIRNRNFGILFTVPSFGMVDKQIRETVQYVFEMKNINRVTKTSLIKVNEVVVDRHTGEIRFNKPVVQYYDKVWCVPNLVSHKPAQEWIRTYEAKKSNFQSTLYNEDYSKKGDGFEKDYAIKTEKARNKYSEHQRERNETWD